MEANELKELWSDYDRKISENLRLNEEILIKLTRDKSRREMGNILNYEYFNFIVFAVFTPPLPYGVRYVFRITYFM